MEFHNSRVRILACRICEYALNEYAKGRNQPSIQAWKWSRSHAVTGARPQVKLTRCIRRRSLIRLLRLLQSAFLTDSEVGKWTHIFTLVSFSHISLWPTSPWHMDLAVSKYALVNCSPSLNVLSMIWKLDMFDRQSPINWYGRTAGRVDWVERLVAPLPVVCSEDTHMVSYYAGLMMSSKCRGLRWRLERERVLHSLIILSKIVSS